MPIADPEQKRAYQRAYYLKHREKRIAESMLYAARPERRARARELRQENANRIRAYTRARYIANPSRSILNNAKARAKKMGLEFNLSIEDVPVPAVCPVLGIPLTIGNNKGWSPGAPTLDRIDNSKGYIKGNICVISWRANSLKSDATLAEVERVADYMRRGLADLQRQFDQMRGH